MDTNASAPIRPEGILQRDSEGLELLKRVSDYRLYCDKLGTSPRPYGAYCQEMMQAELELRGWITEPMLDGVQLYRKPWNKHEIIYG